MADAPLRSLCQIKHGGTPSKANVAFWNGDIPWVSPKDMKTARLIDASDHISADAILNSATSVVPEGSILLVARSGILTHTLPVAQVGRPLAFNQDIKALIPDPDKIDPDYLYWFLRGSEKTVIRQGVKKGATVHSIQSGFIENLQVPIIPRDEQRRIVDILSRAEGIVQLRREAEKKAAEIIPALFIDMFGDPTTNPKGWPMTSVGQLATYTRYGPRFPDRQYADEGAHILRTTDIGYNGDLRWFEAPILPMNKEEIEKYSLKPKTLLVTRTGATIGKTALFEGSNKPCIAGAYLIEIGVSADVIPEYVLHFFLSQVGQSHLIGGSPLCQDSCRIF